MNEQHESGDCPLRMVAPCGFCAARCSHEHSEDCEQNWARTYAGEAR